LTLKFGRGVIDLLRVDRLAIDCRPLVYFNELLADDSFGNLDF
jgi:hypothetical protein